MAIKFVDKEPEDAGKAKKVLVPKAQPQADSVAVDHTEPAPNLPFGKSAPKKKGRKS